MLSAQTRRATSRSASCRRGAPRRDPRVVHPAREWRRLPSRAPARRLEHGGVRDIAERDAPRSPSVVARVRQPPQGRPRRPPANQPCAARSSAVALPIPAPAPVTTTLRAWTAHRHQRCSRLHLLKLPGCDCWALRWSTNAIAFYGTGWRGLDVGRSSGRARASGLVRRHRAREGRVVHPRARTAARAGGESGSRQVAHRACRSCASPTAPSSRARSCSTAATCSPLPRARDGATCGVAISAWSTRTRCRR